MLLCLMITQNASLGKRWRSSELSPNDGYVGVGIGSRTLKVDWFSFGSFHPSSIGRYWDCGVVENLVKCHKIPPMMSWR